MKRRAASVVILCALAIPSIASAQQTPSGYPAYPAAAPQPAAQPHAYGQPQGYAQYPYAQHPYAQSPYAQSSPYAAPYAQPYPLAPAADTQSGPSGTGLLIGGTLTLGSFYLASVLTGAGLSKACDAGAPEELEGTDIEISLCGEADVEMAYVPIVGPFIAMGQLQDTELSFWPLDVALIGVGVGQLTGLGLLVAGAIVGSQAPDESQPQLTVQPAVGPTAASLTMHATF